jgi:meiotically up-regulated gene 157 (Mug157) protein
MEKQQLDTMQEFKNEAYKFSRLTRTTTETLMLEGIGKKFNYLLLSSSLFCNL